MDLLCKNPTQVYVLREGPEDTPSLEQQNTWVGHEWVFKKSIFKKLRERYPLQYIIDSRKWYHTALLSSVKRDDRLAEIKCCHLLVKSKVIRSEALSHNLLIY